jgi:hypothetical protein
MAQHGLLLLQALSVHKALLALLDLQEQQVHRALREILAILVLRDLLV